jgi:signal transduction histidine kinase/DNA-binding response OmpR family regulator
MPVHRKISAVIVVAVLVIIISGLAVGAAFLTKSITKSIENHMLVAVDIADQYVTAELELLKFRAAAAAKDIERLYRAGQRAGVLERIAPEYPRYIGLAVFDRTTLRDSWGVASVPPGLVHEPFMQVALTGGQAVSTTMHCLSGEIVMYVSAPISDGLVLAAVLPGLHFSRLVAQFTFWESGHLFVDDEEGTVIANIRDVWVQQRMNFVERAKTNSAHEGLANMAMRGIAGERGVAHFRVNNVPRICAFRPVSSATENWFLGIIAPLPESEVRKIPSGILLIGGIMLALSLLAIIPAISMIKRTYKEVDLLRRKAEASSISKSAFLANMSHEIRTPMNSIIGFSELALDDDISSRTRDYIGKIRTNAEWLLQIINDILDISKIESGKLELENIPFDMHDLFASCRTLIMPKAVEKGIILHFYAEPSIGKRPLGDPTRLRQVITNLLSNAIKFTDLGMVKLHAVLKSSSGKTITMYFEVKDSGIGMTPEQIKKIFDPFSQAEAGTTRKYGGTGLGLTITKDIIEMMGGELLVESIPGIGSKFSFDLTFETVDVLESDLFDKRIIINEFEKPIFEGEVLLCEDNVMNQQVISEHLARVGLKTVVVGDGKTGIEMVQGRKMKGEKQFDLIFMDIHMPVMDGLEAASGILALDVSVPMVAMTANIMVNDREVYKASGMRDCVGKPFTSQELWRCLLKYFTPVSWQAECEAHRAKIESVLRQKLINNFVRDNRGKMSEIERALESENMQLAHRLVHTLKGTAGQLGKSLLQQVAAEIEHLLKEGKWVAPNQMARLEMELDAVLAVFTPLVVDENFTAPSEGVIRNLDKDASLALLAELEPLLASGNPECRKLVGRLRRLPGAEELLQQMEDLDFDAAMVALVELRKQLEGK